MTKYYAPMTNSHGTQKRCLIKGCDNVARHGPWGRQRCVEHGQQVLERRRAAELRRREAPKCRSCGEPLMSEARVEGGYCAECERQQIEIDAQQRKIDRFNAAKTVEELKDWMQEYLLN